MSKLSREMKKSQESLTEVYVNEAGHTMAILKDAKGIDRHISVAFLVAMHFVPNPTGALFVGFKDGDITNLNADNLYWLDEEPKNNDESRVSDAGD